MLQICLYHVLVNFGREITTTKRNITKDERDAVLEVIQRLVYSTSEESYDSAYQELLDLNLEDVIEYYNDNWHQIRNEWTLYGRNKYSNYLNWTNIAPKASTKSSKCCRTDTPTFSHSSTIYLLQYQFWLQNEMRVPRRRFDDECLTR